MQAAVIIMFIAMSMIPAGDSAGKLLTTTLGVAPVFVAWSRFALGTAMVLPFLARTDFAVLKDRRIWLRAAVLAAGITAIQTALKSTDIATVFAAFFIGPLFSYVLAVIFLKEPVTLLRSLLILAGFAGVLLVVRPQSDMAPGVLWAVLAGLCYGAYLTMSRWLRDAGSPRAMVFSQLLISSVLLLPVGIVTLPDFTTAIIVLTILSALFSMLGNLLLLYAYRLAPATHLAPLIYFQLIAAVILGYAIFGALPDGYTWAGLALILSAGIVSARLR